MDEQKPEWNKPYPPPPPPIRISRTEDGKGTLELRFREDFFEPHNVRRFWEEIQRLDEWMKARIEERKGQR